MVALVIIIMLMNIAVATALPKWSTIIQREKEEELIFRGFQYAEAIRVFQQRHGRLPVRLKELIEVEPRSIRRLWEDPITDSPDWGLVLAAGNRGANLTPQQRAALRKEKGRPGDPSRDVGLPGSDNKDLPKGPIIGVFSRSTDGSIKVLFDQQSYSEWKFTVQAITGGSAAGQGASAADGGGTRGGGPVHMGEVAIRQRGGKASTPRFGIRWLGRPFRPGVQPLDGAAAGNRDNGLPPSSMTTSQPGVGPNGRPAGQSGAGQDLVPGGKN